MRFAIRDFLRPVDAKVRSRPIVQVEEWTTLHTAGRNAEQKRVALEVVSILGRACRVHPTQVWPADDLFSDYRFSAKCLLCRLWPNERWEQFTQGLGEYVVQSRGRELTESESQRIFGWTTVESMIDDVIALMRDATGDS